MNAIAELTIEDALKELREMFEVAYLWIEHTTLHAAEPDQALGTKERWSVGVAYRRFNADTLIDCMAHVREWKAREQV